MSEWHLSFLQIRNMTQNQGLTSCNLPKTPRDARISSDKQPGFDLWKFQIYGCDSVNLITATWRPDKRQSGTTFSSSASLFLLLTPQSCFGLDFFEDLDWVSWGYLSSFLTKFQQCTLKASLRYPGEKQVIRSKNKHGSTPSLTSRERFVYILHLIKTSSHFPGHANLSKLKTPPRCVWQK